MGTIRRLLHQTVADGRAYPEAVVRAMIGKAKAGDLKARNAIGRVIANSVTGGLGSVGTICDRAGVSVKIGIEF